MPPPNHDIVDFVGPTFEDLKRQRTERYQHHHRRRIRFQARVVRVVTALGKYVPPPFF